MGVDKCGVRIIVINVNGFGMFVKQWKCIDKLNSWVAIDLQDENEALRKRVQELNEWQAKASKTMAEYVSRSPICFKRCVLRRHRSTPLMITQAPKREKIKKAQQNAKDKLRLVIRKRLMRMHNASLVLSGEEN